MIVIRGETRMELLTKLEHTVAGWLKEVPHLPNAIPQWLGNNLWWIALVGAIVSGLGAFGLVIGLFSSLSVLASPFVAYYASSTFVVVGIIRTIISLIFVVLTSVLLAMAVTPLKEKQKKGWVLLFVAWLVNAASVVIGAIVTLNPFSFLTSIIFGALWILVELYFIYEVRGQFAHVEKSKGVSKKA